MNLGRYPSAQEDPIGEGLRNKIEGWIKHVENHQKHLPMPDSPAVNALAFRKYQEFYKEMAGELKTYTKTKKHKYYDYLKRSDNRSGAANDAIKAARETAKRFERYQKRPKNYSQVDSYLSLGDLLIELTNLLDFCK